MGLLPSNPGHSISIHALREEGDLERANHIRRINLFLSTPSARRATEELNGLISAALISIHALREEGDVYRVRGADDVRISIHALREEGDIKQKRQAAAIAEFLSTPSARRATTTKW